MNNWNWDGERRLWINSDTGETMTDVEWDIMVRDTRIAKLEAENAKLRKWNNALRINTSKSVLRKLEAQLGEEE